MRLQCNPVDNNRHPEVPREQDMTQHVSVEEKLAVQELLSRAAYALDEHAMEDLAGLFAENARFSMRIAGGELAGPFEGRAAIMDMMNAAVSAQTDKRRHVVSNVFFGERDASGVVEVTSNLTLLATEDGEIRLLTAGVYHDRVIQQGGDWRLLGRHLELDKPY